MEKYFKDKLKVEQERHTDFKEKRVPRWHMKIYTPHHAA